MGGRGGGLPRHAAASAIRAASAWWPSPAAGSATDAPEPETFATAGVRRKAGEWSVYVEAVPAPLGPSWPEAPEGQTGWGVAAPAEPEVLAMVGALVAEAVSAWAASPLDVVLTFEKQPDGPWPPDETPPAVARLLDEMRAEVDELLSTRRLTGALELSARTSVHFNHTTFPVFFTGDLQSRLVLVHQNPHQSTNEGAEHEGAFEYADFDDYLDRHRRSGHYRWELGDDYPSPADYKELRFLRHWGVIDLVDGGSREEERSNVVRAVDQRLQLELIPYGSARFPVDIPIEALAPHYERTLARGHRLPTRLRDPLRRRARPAARALRRRTRRPPVPAPDLDRREPRRVPLQQPAARVPRWRGARRPRAELREPGRADGRLRAGLPRALPEARQLVAHAARRVRRGVSQICAVGRPMSGSEPVRTLVARPSGSRSNTMR